MNCFRSTIDGGVIQKDDSSTAFLGVTLVYAADRLSFAMWLTLVAALLVWNKWIWCCALKLLCTILMDKIWMPPSRALSTNLYMLSGWPTEITKPKITLHMFLALESMHQALFNLHSRGLIPDGKFTWSGTSYPPSLLMDGRAECIVGPDLKGHWVTKPLTIFFTVLGRLLCEQQLCD